MFIRLILRTVASLCLLIVPAVAQQAREDVRLPFGFVLIETDSVPVSIETVSAQADDVFAGMDVDGDGRIDLAELKAWRNATQARDGEDVLALLLDMDAKGMLQGADHNGDEILTPTEVRALAFYDFAVHDADGDGVLISEELATWQPTLLQWASRPCLEFGIGEGMLLGAFCGK